MSILILVVHLVLLVTVLEYLVYPVFWNADLTLFILCLVPQLAHALEAIDATLTNELGDSFETIMLAAIQKAYNLKSQQGMCSCVLVCVCVHIVVDFVSCWVAVDLISSLTFTLFSFLSRSKTPALYPRRLSSEQSHTGSERRIQPRVAWPLFHWCAACVVT